MRNLILCSNLNSDRRMINRIWFTIYWATIAYLLLAVLVLIVSFTAWKDTPIEKNPAVTNTQKITKHLSQKFFFNFIEYRIEDCYFYETAYQPLLSYSYIRTIQESCRTDKVSSRQYIKINNMYPFLLIILLFSARWVVTGKPPNEIEKLDN